VELDFKELVDSLINLIMDLISLGTNYFVKLVDFVSIGIEIIIKIIITVITITKDLNH
jgi:hypothetical protein